MTDMTPSKLDPSKSAMELADELLSRSTEPRWQKAKPADPGEYYTRHAADGSSINTVVVTRVGRGLSVYCPACNDRVPMSAIGADELEWAKKGASRE